MAEQSPQLYGMNVGIVTNGLHPLFKVPAGFGGVTLLGAEVTFEAAGTAGLYLINAGAVGTSTGSDGTLATYGGTAYTAHTPVAMTMASSPYIGAGSYVAVKENNTGASSGTTTISIAYKFGK